MTLSVNQVGDNAFQPGVTAETYVPDQLIAGDMKLVTDSVTITGAAAYVRGTLMGQVLCGAVTSAAKSGGNTGNGTAVVDGTTPRLANVQAGVYQLRCTIAGTNSATFRLYDPKGRVLKDYAYSGSGASVTTDDQIKVAITDGSADFAVGDGFDVTVADVSSLKKYTKAVATAVDGSADPKAILVDASDCTGGDVTGGVYLQGEFNPNAITFDASWTAATAQPPLRQLGIFLKTSVSAADPS